MRLPKSKAVLAAVAAAVVVLGGAGTAVASTYKTITVKDNGQRRTLRGFGIGTIAEFLQKHDVHVSDRDRVRPALDSSVVNGEIVEIVSPKPVTIDYEGKVEHTWTFAHTVGELLKTEGITLKPSDHMNLATSERVTSGETVEIHNIVSKTTTQTQEIPFQTIRRNASDLEVGHKEYVTHGVKGLLEIQTTSVYRDGHKISQHVVKRVVRNPVDEVVEVGTMQLVHHPVLATRSANPDPGLIRGSLTVLATAYAAGGLTATGVPAEPGVIAVDPSVIPLGSRVYIPGIGTVVAADTGSAIVGDHIDICMASNAQADAWGARTITIYLEQ
ncbi:uncharacterized protein DUF348 [Alicyclobacillus sacchari]|uniref:Uncharacterized protein DUF348 n=1 Tax=Alicyclobacillus sacchari TaxID=392010 RepID=A0A4R8LNH4_9BACL|nr:3D domain-containing protein [Alicyclobacillus sacchari]TDY47828.1 uncharacterized protein DUF348 [Alicyclobacillus sacchari]GMA55907.1 hypothetical protein GCM10025858_04100 [Alicyclobacillus sacchari]